MASKSMGVLPSSEEIREQLKLILQSPEFGPSGRLREFLSYVVDETLAGREKQIKAYSIGVEVFKLGASFDPVINPTIRVHAGRLRAKLERYYHASPNQDKVYIDIPKGSYLPVFTYIPPNNLDESSIEQHPNRENSSEKLDANNTSLSNQTPYALSILILPFSRIHSEPGLFSFLQGLTKALLMDLNRFGEFKLFTANIEYPEKADACEEAQKVGARFVLSGSGQLDNTHLRLHMSLIDASTRSYIWTDQFDGLLTDSSFELQDSFASQIVARVADSYGSINRTLFEEQLKKPLDDLDIQESILYYHNWAAPLNFPFFARIKEILEQSVELHPHSAILKAMLSDIYALHYKWGLNIFENDLEQSLKLANEALDLDNRCRYAHWVKAFNCFFRKDKAGFIEFVQSSLELNPLDTNILASAGVNMVLVGETEKGMEMVDAALRLNPHIPRWHRIASFIVHYLDSEYEQALNCVRHIMPSDDFWMHIMRAAAHGQLRDLPAAQSEIQKLLLLSPGFRENCQSVLPRFFFHESIADQIMEGLELGWA